MISFTTKWYLWFLLKQKLYLLIYVEFCQTPPVTTSVPFLEKSPNHTLSPHQDVLGLNKCNKRNFCICLSIGLLLPRIDIFWKGHLPFHSKRTNNPPLALPVLTKGWYLSKLDFCELQINMYWVILPLSLKIIFERRQHPEIYILRGEEEVVCKINCFFIK